MKVDVTSPALLTDASTVHRLLDTIRDTSTAMLEKALLPDANTPETSEVIKEHGRDGFVALAQLRTLHRLLHSEVDVRRQQTSSYEGDAFLGAMQVLQSTKYERDSFKATVESQPAIDSVSGITSEEDYVAESVNHPLGPKDSDSQHERTLKRLKFEEDRRKALRSKLKEIPGKQNALKAALNLESRDMTTIKQHIRDIGRQVTNLQHTMKMQDLTLQPSDARASSLPQPLYNLYVQLISWITVFGGDQLDITISGSATAESNASKAPAKEQRGSRHKRSQTADNSSDGGLSSTECQQTHPLSVIAHFLVGTSSSSASSSSNSASNSSSNDKMSFMFEYLVNLNVVVVTPLNNEDPRVLVNLYENDDGESSPNPANRLQVSFGTEWLPKRARAYKWVQSLCGLHFLPDVTATAAISSVSQSNALTSSNPPSVGFINQPASSTIARIPLTDADRAKMASSLTDTIELLKKRLKTRLDFNKNNSTLNSGQIDREKDAQPGRPENIASVATIRKWILQTPSQAQQLLKDFDEYCANSQIPALDARAEYNNNNSYFLAAFSTPGSTQTARFVVSLPPEYPEKPPKGYILGSKDLPATEVKKMMAALDGLLPAPTVPDRPETLVNYLLAWLQECLSIHHDIAKRREQSPAFSNELRYHTSTWNAGSS